MLPALINGLTNRLTTGVISGVISGLTWSLLPVAPVLAAPNAAEESVPPPASAVLGGGIRLSAPFRAAQPAPEQVVVLPEQTPAQRELVLDRRNRHLTVLENGQKLRRFPVAVGRPGWETPVGRFAVIERVADPSWEHPATGETVPPGPANPLGSRWIGFHRDCLGRSGFNGREHLVVEGCVSAGFHGTPNRDSVGLAVSHGCVRLFDEHVRELFELVELGTPVTVLP
jgi:lipoprotein-anchoring transpeptidase ErfK/SrfK